MKGYGFTIKGRISGILFQTILFSFGTGGLIYLSKKVQYVWIFAVLLVLMVGTFFIIDVLFNFLGAFVVINDGIRYMLGRWQINKFPWTDLKRIDIRRRWGQPIEVALWTKKNRVKCFGKEIEGYPAFFNEILDSAAKHGGVEIKELEW